MMYNQAIIREIKYAKYPSKWLFAKYSSRNN